jgi:MFS family permease
MHYCKEKGSIIIGLAAIVIASVLNLLADQVWQVFAIAVIQGVGLLIFPTVSSLKSNNVNDSEQGQIQGALYAVRACFEGIGRTSLSLPPLPLWLPHSTLTQHAHRPSLVRLPFRPLHQQEGWHSLLPWYRVLVRGRHNLHGHPRRVRPAKRRVRRGEKGPASAERVRC